MSLQRPNGALHSVLKRHFHNNNDTRLPLPIPAGLGAVQEELMRHLPRTFITCKQRAVKPQAGSRIGMRREENVHRTKMANSGAKTWTVPWAMRGTGSSWVKKLSEFSFHLFLPSKRSIFASAMTVPICPDNSSLVIIPIQPFLSVPDNFPFHTKGVTVFLIVMNYSIAWEHHLKKKRENFTTEENISTVKCKT